MYLKTYSLCDWYWFLITIRANEFHKSLDTNTDDIDKWNNSLDYGYWLVRQRDKAHKMDNIWCDSEVKKWIDLMLPTLKKVQSTYRWLLAGIGLKG